MLDAWFAEGWSTEPPGQGAVGGCVQGFSRLTFQGVNVAPQGRGRLGGMKANLPQPDDSDGTIGAEPETRRMVGRARGPEAKRPRTERELRDSLLRDSLIVTHVDGMHSHRCEEIITSAVAAMPGVREVEVDFASGQASVIFDARRVSAHQVIGVIEAVGYRCADSAMSNDGGSLE